VGDDLGKGFITLGSLNDPGELLFKSPMRHAHIAEWTSEHQARIAMTLNRLGEILIFRERELIFARRAGHWHYLTHDPVISQMNVPRDIPLRQAIYDDLPNSQSIKSRSLRKIIRGTSFSNLDRKLRQELAAIDGATIISHTGDILAVGAILKVPGGSAGGGGRLAAAKALAAYGLGIKVSQDGSITGYRRDKTDEAFRIM
jgi:hypothetical protein